MGRVLFYFGPYSLGGVVACESLYYVLLLWRCEWRPWGLGAAASGLWTDLTDSQSYSDLIDPFPECW